MRAYIPLVLAISFSGWVHANPLLALSGVAMTILGQTAAEIVIKTLLKNGETPVKLLQDPGTILSDPNCTTILSSRGLAGAPIGCMVPDRSEQQGRGSEESMDERKPSGKRLKSHRAKSGRVRKGGRTSRIKSRQAPAIIELQPGETYEHQFKLGDYYDLSKLLPGTYEVQLYNRARYMDSNGIFLLDIPKPSKSITFDWPPSS